MAVIIRRLGYAQISTTGGATAGYSQVISTGSWTLNAGEYEITVPVTLHGKGANPQVDTYQLVGSDYEHIITGVFLNSSGDVTIKVNQTPDARFQGKVVIR